MVGTNTSEVVGTTEANLVVSAALSESSPPVEVLLRVDAAIHVSYDLASLGFALFGLMEIGVSKRTLMVTRFSFW
jgi:hypothetical protein